MRELDPLARCGPGTSVEQLFRVDELLDGRQHVHLVYLDHHGWYCFHGPSCPAVTDVRRELRAAAAAQQPAATRRSQGAARSSGQQVTHGTTRARASGR